MKDFFKKLSRTQDDVEDLDTGYDSEYYQGSYDRDRRQDDRRPDRYEDRTPEADRYAPRGWQEADAPAYRERPEEKIEPVFAPEPAPEYLYFTPASYRDCREGIVRGLAAGHVVVVRLGELESNDVLRLFDYMMGAVLALEGEIVRPQATTVVLLPNGVALDEDALELDEEDEEDDEDGEEYEEEYEDEYDDEDGEYGGYDEEDSEQDAE